jgi:hypothetical protein
MGYYLAYGIYPDWPAFMKTIRNPYDVRTQHFATIQEFVTKDIERTFGVLQKRWVVVRGPAYGWAPEHIGDIMKTCIILHNIIVEDEGPMALNTSFDNIEVLTDTTQGSMAELGMATGIYSSSNSVPYSYPLIKIVPVKLPIYARGYRILHILVPTWVILPVG